MTARHRCNQQLEVFRTQSAGGFPTWSVVLRDLRLGLRRIDSFYTKPEAIRAAERLSRKMLVPLDRTLRPNPKRLATRVKHALFQKRQERVARRAAKRRRS